MKMRVAGHNGVVMEVRIEYGEREVVMQCHVLGDPDEKLGVWGWSFEIEPEHKHIVEQTLQLLSGAIRRAETLAPGLSLKRSTTG